MVLTYRQAMELHQTRMLHNSKNQTRICMTLNIGKLADCANATYWKQGSQAGVICSCSGTAVVQKRKTSAVYTKFRLLWYIFTISSNAKDN